MSEKALEIGVGILVIFIVISCIIYGVAKLGTNSACLSYGYKSAKIDYALNAYCIKRVNQTDVVIPLSKAKHEKR